MVQCRATVLVIKDPRCVVLEALLVSLDSYGKRLRIEGRLHLVRVAGRHLRLLGHGDTSRLCSIVLARATNKSVT